MQKKLITGALFLKPWPWSPASSPYFLRREDAANLGVLPPSSSATNGSSSLYNKSYINAMSTTNPLMFHDDFCAENEIPVLVGYGPLTEPNIREESRRLCQRHGWSTKPARWITLLDILDTGLLPALMASARISSLPDVGHPQVYSRPLLQQIFSSVATLDMHRRVTSDAASQLWTGSCAIHIDYLCNNAENRQRGVTQSMFHESRWPSLMVKVPPTRSSHGCVIAAAGFTSSMYGYHLRCPPAEIEHWVHRRWLDAKFVPYRDPSRALFPASFDTGMIHVDRELTHLTEAQRGILKTYEPKTPWDKTSQNALKQMFHRALEFPEAISPYWGTSAPSTFKENPAVPAISIECKEKICAWRNFVPLDSSIQARSL
ncbi:Hypothetical protein, putative [Bodo saltans]|uniref:Uncharacterized protein n=1 Tax=Bodo saltans TaxID=75058 RepID=A0A0S4JFP4_BODSA|nr:Hypothetical protein, putative [Bodo saltans]|eukprot:CUG87220.1 Hypothetical protein, putative [Bodo saltans]